MNEEMELAQTMFLQSGGIYARALLAKKKSGEHAKSYEFTEYPKLLRMNPREEEVPHRYYVGNQNEPRTEYRTETVYDEIIVHSEEEEERVLHGGKTSMQVEQERQDLILRARSLGLKVDVSWSAVRLRREMGDKLDAPAPEDKMARLAAELDQLRKMAAMEEEIAALKARLAPPDPDDMRGQLEALGVKVDGRWSATRLREELDKATSPERAA